MIGPFDPCRCGHARPDHYDGIGLCMADECGCEGMAVSWAHQHAPEASQPKALPDVRVVASECDLYGHDYQVRDMEERDPNRYARWRRVPGSVFCGRCGKSWKVER